MGADARDHADVMVDWGAGTELVGYVTKGVTTLALFLMMFAARLGGRPERMADLAAAVEVLDAVRASTYEFYRAHEKALTSMRLSYSIAADGARGVALEGALKIGETVHVPSPAYEVEEFIHGPNLQITPAYTMFFFDAPDAARERCRLIYRAAREVSDAAFLVTSAPRQPSPPRLRSSPATRRPCGPRTSRCRPRLLRLPAVRAAGEPSGEQRARQLEAASPAQAVQGDRRGENRELRELRRR